MLYDQKGRIENQKGPVEIILTVPQFAKSKGRILKNWLSGLKNS